MLFVFVFVSVFQCYHGELSALTPSKCGESRVLLVCVHTIAKVVVGELSRYIWWDIKYEEGKKRIRFFTFKWHTLSSVRSVVSCESETKIYAAPRISFKSSDDQNFESNLMKVQKNDTLVFEACESGEMIGRDLRQCSWRSEERKKYRKSLNYPQSMWDCIWTCDATETHKKSSSSSFGLFCCCFCCGFDVAREQLIFYLFSHFELSLSKNSSRLLFIISINLKVKFCNLFPCI